MEINDVLKFNTQVLFIVLTIIALVDYLLRGSVRRRDFFFFAFALGFPLGITFLRRFTPLNSGLLDLVGAYALFSQPYFLFRLLQYYKPSRPKMGILILAGFLLCCILPLSGMNPVKVTIIFIYCSAAEAYATWGFYQTRRNTHGTLRRRLTIVTMSSAIFTIAFVINAVKAQFPGLGITPYAQIAAAVSAILFYVAFIPPRWLRRAWQMEELHDYLARTRLLSPDDNFMVETLQELSQTAKQTTYGFGAGVLSIDELTKKRSVSATTDQDLFERLAALDLPYLTEILNSHTSTYCVVSKMTDANQRRQLEALGARTWLFVPIQSQDHFGGLLIVAIKGHSLFIEDNLDMLGLLTQQCGLILNNYRLVDALKNSLDQLQENMEERQRISSDLHDAVTQTLFSASIATETLPRLLQRSPELGIEQANTIVRLNRAMMAEMRTLLHEMRPEMFLQTRLSTLLQQLIDAAKGRKEIESEIVVDGSEDTLPPDVRTVFFRIAQECVANMVKHSQAATCSIKLRIDPQTAWLQIHDDGKGFDPQVTGDGFGLAIMQEHAESIGAMLSIQSQPNDGTTISVKWKIESEIAA